MVVRGLEEPAPARVGKPLDHRVCQLARGHEAARVERRLVEAQQRLDQEGVVLEVAVELCGAVLEAPQQAPIAVAKIAQDEFRAPRCGLEIVRALQHGPRVGERGDHQRVPGGQPLVVQPRPDALRATVVQAAANLLQSRRSIVTAGEDVAPLEVAGFDGPEVADRGAGVVAESLAELVERPDVEAALLPLGVRV